MIDTPAGGAEKNLSRTPPIPSDGTCRSSHQGQVQAAPPLKRKDPQKKQFHTRPPPLKEGLGLNLNPSHGHKEDDEDSISKSPVLTKFAVARDDAPPDFILLALQQKSPPRSSPAGSPDQKQSLLNLKTAIGDLQDASFTRFATIFPMDCPSPGHFAQYASLASYSAISPRAPIDPPSHYDFRTTTPDLNTSTSSYTSSSTAASAPSSSIAGPSLAASHSSPLAAVLDQDRDRTRRESFETESKSLSELRSEAPPGDGSSSTRFISGAYKSTYHRCTATSFQPQYLLNSHANVHSNIRTHFCPVKGCRRGSSGQGFKRKNEMIRCATAHTIFFYMDTNALRFADIAWFILLRDTYVPSVRINHTNTLGQIIYGVTYGNITRTKTKTIPYFATFSTSDWKEVAGAEEDVKWSKSGKPKPLRRINCLPRWEQP
ncbi:hypothetical protein Z517_00763 [Fonsecaea pedrosoi CBS 271.37]|uniref:Unplaced genomic scaffold supercont1.1, whole genome shotgun sequence n=1 Tax=Fonsecaea pedrosoi CBS 271.37 TaxID=1442368 RepID=A0A0D2GWJ3_9EURO|nr:uncharacterized protein Z517_00763 [Fonsecaea pedrosoi CBS 271.37]KIW85373.1 hypothetical protein Z517_00763 [Fonsecaea pedrosoi CBS 271.37]